MKVLVQLISGTDERLIKKGLNKAKESFENISFFILKDKISAPPDCFNALRRQYESSCLILNSLRVINKREIILIVADLDAYVEQLNFVFGEAIPSLKAAAVYIRRLIPHPYNEKLLISRLAKEINHELGHVFGLEHCNNSRCVMSFSNSVMDVDYKTIYFCDKCRKALMKVGVIAKPGKSL